jgi:hypothetical protein
MSALLKGMIIGLMKRMVNVAALRWINYGSSFVLVGFGLYSLYRFGIGIWIGGRG